MKATGNSRIVFSLTILRPEPLLQAGEDRQAIERIRRERRARAG